MRDIPQDLHILQHSLGVDQYGRGEQYRNRFITGPGSLDFDICIGLVWAGLMMRRDGNALTGGDDLFVVTPAGKAYVAQNSPQPPKLTRSQRRYRRYLDADCSMSFGEWMRSPRAREATHV